MNSIVSIILLLLVMLTITTYIYREPIYDCLVGITSMDDTTPFINIKDKAFAKSLKENYDDIRGEVENSLPLFTSIRGDEFFEDIIGDDKWKKIYLKWYAKSPNYAYELFPKAMSIIDKYPEIKLAMFSLLEPGAVIYPHRGPFRGCIRVHFTIKSPNSPECFIEVGGEKYWWKDGEIVGFDDTYEHRVENRTDKYRVILFLDIKREFKFRWMKVMNDLLINYIAPSTNRVNSELMRKVKSKNI